MSTPKSKETCPTLDPLARRTAKRLRVLILSIPGRMWRFTARVSKKSWKPALAVFLVFVVIHSIATMILGRRYEAAIEALRAKGEPVAFADFKTRPIPEDQNGAVIYEKIFKKLKDENTEQDMTKLWYVLQQEGVIITNEQDRSVLKALPDLWGDAKKAAARQTDLIPLIEEAQAKPRCQFPVKWETGLEALFPHLAQLRAITRFLAAHAIVQARDGNMDQAIHDIILAFGVSRSVKDEPALVSMLIANACDSMANDGLDAVLKYGKPTDAHMQTLHSILSEVNLRPQFKAGMKGERVLGMWAFNMVHSKGAEGIQTLNYLVSGLEHPDIISLPNIGIITVIWRPMLYADGCMYLRRIQRYIDYTDKSYRWVKKTNIDHDAYNMPRYALINRIMTPEYSRVFGYLDNAAAKIGMTQILMAVRIYKAKTGAYPQSLSDLRKESKWKIPIDPFSGKDYIYRRTAKGFHIRSIGLNLKDDGGEPYKETMSMDHGDLVLNWNQ